MKTFYINEILKVVIVRYNYILKTVIILFILNSFAFAYTIGNVKSNKNIQEITSSITYYVSSSTGDNNRSPAEASNSNTPWESIDNINSLKLNPGDSVLFKRGDIFYGSLKLSVKGTKEKPIVIGAYGIGANPIISGAISLSNWTEVKSGVWSTELSQSPGYVFQKNQLLPVSKYPVGYLTVDSVLSPTSFRVKEDVSNSWIGATVGIQYVNFAMGFQPIVSINSNVITLKLPPQMTYVGGQVANITKGRPFFISNNVSLFRNDGDWSYDSLQKLLFVKSNNSPEMIDVSHNLTGISIQNSKNVNIQDIDIEKTISFGIEIIPSGSSIYLNNIHTKFTGNAGINIPQGDSITIRNCIIEYSGIYGINIRSSNSIVQNCKINNIGLNWEIIYPFSQSLHVGYGLYCSGNNADLSSNIIDSTGYNGINFDCKKNLIYNNRVTNYCLQLTDGAGIYTSWSNSAGSVVHDNIIQQTNFSDPKILIEGIYLDDKNLNCKIENNTIIGNRFGIFMHNASQEIISNNKIINPLYAGIFSQNDGYAGIPVGNNEITGNSITVNRTGVYLIGYTQNSLSDGIGIIDKNIYQGLNFNPTFIFYNNKNRKIYTINEWKSIGYDKNSLVK
jgi:parallel beta-helix repeat protein